MFLLGRWSGTGLFPLVLDMVADTIDHLRLNADRLSGFPADIEWYQGQYTGTRTDPWLFRLEQESNTPSAVSPPNKILVPFAIEVVKAFDEGRLFDFLRGEHQIVN